MPTHVNNGTAVYPPEWQQDEPGVRQDERAGEHRREALTALAAGDELAGLAHAVLAVEARLEELVCFVALR